MKLIKTTVERHLNKLCGEIGARATGSAANQQAVNYSAEVFETLGYEVTLQEFSCMDWQNDGAELVVDGQSVEIEAAEYSLPCEVTGEFVCVSTIEELAAADLTNKICVLYGDLCKEPLMPKSMIFWNPEEHQAIIRELETKQPLAVITVSFLPEVAVPIIQDGDFEIPCGAVKGEVLPSLLNSQGDNQLRLFTERRPATAANVIATKGTGKKLSFSAHIDTKPTTPGALDNGSGVATLLTLAEQLSSVETGYQIEMVLFNGEDYYSMPGEMAFMSQSLNDPAAYHCAFNVDGVGMQDSSTSYSFYEFPAELQQRIEEIAAVSPQLEPTNPWPMGDHMLFAGAGIPAVALTATNIYSLMESVMHTPNDNLSIVDFERIVETVEFLEKVVHTI